MGSGSGVQTIADAEFGGDEHVLAPPGDGLADQQFVAMRPIGVGGIEEVQAPIQGVMQGGDGFAVVAVAVEIAHAHGAPAIGLQALAALLNQE